jgi:hypothetical protein
MLHQLFKHRFLAAVLEQTTRLPGSPDKDLERAGSKGPKRSGQRGHQLLQYPQPKEIALACRYTW